MALAEYRDGHAGVELLQRSLQRGRLGHAYLFSGGDLAWLEGVSRNLAKVLNCKGPRPGGEAGERAECCDECSSCRRIDGFMHPDVLWVRPESKSRVILIDQVREVLHAMNMKATEARTKVAVMADADRMNPQAANAFLKTLEEPPGRAVLILLVHARRT